MRSFITYLLSAEGEFARTILLTMAAILVVAGIIDYLRWRNK